MHKNYVQDTITICCNDTSIQIKVKGWIFPNPFVQSPDPLGQKKTTIAAFFWKNVPNNKWNQLEVKKFFIASILIQSKPLFCKLGGALLAFAYFRGLVRTDWSHISTMRNQGNNCNGHRLAYILAHSHGTPWINLTMRVVYLGGRRVEWTVHEVCSQNVGLNLWSRESERISMSGSISWKSDLLFAIEIFAVFDIQINGEIATEGLIIRVWGLIPSELRASLVDPLAV